MVNVILERGLKHFLHLVFIVPDNLGPEGRNPRKGIETL